MAASPALANPPPVTPRPRPHLYSVGDAQLMSTPRLMLKEAPAVDDAVAKAALALQDPLSSPSLPSVEGDAAVAVALPVEAAPRRFRWARNVLLGAGVSFMDAGIAALQPLRFVWDNLPVVGLAIIYMALPLLPSFLLLAYVPSLAQTFSLLTPVGAIYFLGLYISSAFLLLAASFTSRFFWRGGLKLMDHFAQAGEQAFPSSK